MALSTDPATITHAIQLSVAPVFLLTAVAGMIGAVAGRLARIIDRARSVEERGRLSTDEAEVQRARHELADLRMRGRLTNACIALLTTCAFLIGLTIIMLFLGEAADVETTRWAVAAFISGVGCFLLALLCFLAETFIATRMLNFRVRRQPSS